MEKEKQKQHLIDIMRGDEELGLYYEPKQETIEEAAEEYVKSLNLKVNVDEYKEYAINDFIAGAEWQAERMYSEEEVLDILYKHTEDLLAGKKVTLEEWFNQFKKENP
jgi:hypothetical protein